MVCFFHRMRGTTQPMDENAFLKANARALGFSLCGVTSALPLEGFGRFEEWLAAGSHAQMAYLATESARLARATPRRLVPDAQSIIVVAAMYPAPTTLAKDDSTAGVAAYALGDDYHEIVSKRLWQLCCKIDAMAGRALRHRVYTDSGPVLERELAQRAGLGWIGRNSMLIHPALGSHFFLGEIITEFPFTADPPFASDRCGACDRCVRACPTGCILPNRTIDAGRCISYLTIEYRGYIPRELRPSVGRWVFGCDVCQSVCPWNHAIKADTEGCFQPRSHFPIAKVADELALEEEEFSVRFRRSPLRRTRREGYRRNAIVASGNAHASQAIPPLIAILENDPIPLLRGHAAWALGQIGGKAAEASIATRAQLEKDATVLAEIHSALIHLLGDSSAFGA
jgi:epoxyqueuosine reductase